MKIHIDWVGSHKLKNINKLTDENDYGVYQIYGTHPIYGSDVLLYIGKADKQTFGVRIPQHEKWLYNQDAKNIRVYTGHLGSNNAQKITAQQWSKEIDISEKLLIFTHKPAYNSSNINTIPENIPIEAHIFNWGSFKNLLPEVSAFRHMATDEEYFSSYSNYGD